MFASKYTYPAPVTLRKTRGKAFLFTVQTPTFQTKIIPWSKSKNGSLELFEVNIYFCDRISESICSRLSFMLVWLCAQSSTRLWNVCSLDLAQQRQEKQSKSRSSTFTTCFAHCSCEAQSESHEDWLVGQEQSGHTAWVRGPASSPNLC